MENLSVTPVAFYRGELASKFGIPRQSGLVPSLRGRIEFTPEFRSREALRGLEGFDRIWLIWGFSANRPAKGEWQPTVRPPRLGGIRQWASGPPAPRSVPTRSACPVSNWNRLTEWILSFVELI